MAPDLLENIEITPREVKEHLERGDKFLFVDVREPWEHQTAHIEGAKLIPLGQIPASLAEIEAAGEVVIFCHHGMRSLDAAAWLRSQGVEGARSMTGGIERWAVEIDPKVPHY
ncbi:MAG: rhodanese-like domain-containing protein [Candidatus Acidiferrales bacterium]